MKGFLLTLLVNLFLNFRGSIPAWILLVLHFWLGISWIWFAIALGVWILWQVIWMFIMGWAAGCSNEPQPHRENKNPYSAKNSDIQMKK